MLRGVKAFLTAQTAFIAEIESALGLHIRFGVCRSLLFEMAGVDRPEECGERPLIATA